VFSIPSCSFYRYTSPGTYTIFNERCQCPVGPAAGPHTQLAQNIITAYISGARVFELKTIQKLDSLEIEKPCIDAEDIGYNTEWSTELSIEQAMEEYIKAWILVHLLDPVFSLSPADTPGCVFNMSVGYDLNGIQSAKVDACIDGLKDAAGTECYTRCISDVHNAVRNGVFKDFTSSDKLLAVLDSLSPRICSSVTLSTMHGCPSEEIEAICRYLLENKQLHTYVKLNPTLLGYEQVRNILNRLGYDAIELDNNSFTHNLPYPDAVAMLKRLQDCAAAAGCCFGIKLSNTLCVINTRGILPGKEMYLSGRSLFPLTISLAAQLSEDLAGTLPISFSGGVCTGNAADIVQTGISPVTVVTDLLKPGGYSRLAGIVDNVRCVTDTTGPQKTIDVSLLLLLADRAKNDPLYAADSRQTTGIKVPGPLPLFDCFTAPCRHTCPINQDIPQYIRLVEEGRCRDACAVILDRNPLPHITGYICDHQCMLKCTRHDYESPVEIRELKRSAAESGFDDYIKSIIPGTLHNDVPVAVIGAGPSGLSAAYFLARAGFPVTVFEKETTAGGIVRNVIPSFRLPQEVIEKDIAFIAQLGVKFHFGSHESFSITELKQAGFKYIYLAIGAGKSAELSLAGDNPSVYNAIDFLWHCKGNPDDITLGRRVAVIGGGNSAMDGARAAIRMEGVETVYILYRRTREFMPADREEFDNAIRDGVIFRELLSPVAFNNDNILTCQVMELGDPDESGRRRPISVEDHFESFEVDSVISAIGESVDTTVLAANSIMLDGTQVIVNPDTHETSIENVYIGGDALNGPSTVVESIADGRTAAEAICTRAHVPFPQPAAIDIDNRQRRIDARACHGRIQLSKERIESAPEAVKEARRCLACDVICEKCVQVCPNRANIAIVVPGDTDHFRDHTQILHLDSLCNECGNCETFCPWHGSPYKDKLTLFSTEQDYRNSSNPGFLLPGHPGNKPVLIRIGEREFTAAKQPDETRYRIPDEMADDTEACRILELIQTIEHTYPFLLPGRPI
jgi:putative selenate reductase